MRSSRSIPGRATSSSAPGRAPRRPMAGVPGRSRPLLPAAGSERESSCAVPPACPGRSPTPRAVRSPRPGTRPVALGVHRAGPEQRIDRRPDLASADRPGDRARRAGRSSTAATRRTLAALGWRPAPEVQPSVTRVIDLGPDEAAPVVRAARQVAPVREQGPVGRGDGRRARRPPSRHLPRDHGRDLRTGWDAIRTEASYRAIWDAFGPSGHARLLFALGPDGRPQAALFLVRAGRRVVEPYGGMTGAGAASRANYLLKWEAIRSSREAGGSSYDMWGLVHPGIRQFKEGFGGREIRLIGAFDLDLRPVRGPALPAGRAAPRPAPPGRGSGRQRGSGEAG